MASTDRAEASDGVEVARLRAHFRTVERELESRDVSHLSAAQRAARARHVQVLRAYAAAGVFPHNHDFPGERIPYFVDEHGTLCAMAYLIARSGHEELVARVAATRNNASIPELAEDAELAAWLDASGLSVEEAARIQPAYNEFPPREEVEPRTLRWGAAAAVTSVIGIGATAINLSAGASPGESRWPAVLGLLSGVAGIALGADRIGDEVASPALGAVTMGVGIAALGAGTWRLVAGRAAGPVAEETSTFSLAVIPPGALEDRLGLVLSARF